jgi:type III pantothenate kinase
VILIDIGNTRAHVYQDGVIEHMNVEDAIARHHAHRVHYINVNPHNTDALSALASWHNVADALHIEGEYDGMGIDRKAVCLSHDTGIFIDAGSAITVDKVEKGRYMGGFLLPGFRAYRRAFSSISSVLNCPIDLSVDLSDLPRDTEQGISYGVMISIEAALGRIRGELPVYVTGGDGMELARRIENSIYDGGLVFSGMQRVVS